MAVHVVQQAYRWRTDATAASGGTPTWGAAQDNPYNAPLDTPIRLRLLFYNDGSSSTSSAWKLELSKNSAAYVSITTGSSNVKAVDGSGGNSSDNSSIATSSFYLTGGLGTPQAGQYDDTGQTAIYTATKGTLFELEFGLQLVSSDLANGDTLDFQLKTSSDVNLQVYNSTPRLTVSISAGTTLSVDKGGYALTGEAISLTKAKILTAATGSYAVTGKAITLTRSRPLNATTGFYGLTGETVAFIKTGNKVLSVDSGAYALTGKAITPVRAAKLSINAGFYSLAGKNNTLTVEQAGLASAALYTSILTPVVLAGPPTLLANTGLYTSTGEPNGFRYQGTNRLTNSAANGAINSTEIWWAEFENNNLSEFSGTSGTVNVVTAPSPVQRGNYAVQFPSGTFNLAYSPTGLNLSTIYTRAYIYLDALPATPSQVTSLIEFRDANNNLIASINIDTNGRLFAYDSAFNYRDLASFTTGTYHLVEVRCSIGAGTGTISLGVDSAFYTIFGMQNGSLPVDRIWFGATSSATNGFNTYMDSLSINSATYPGAVADTGSGSWPSGWATSTPSATGLRWNLVASGPEFIQLRFHGRVAVGGYYYVTPAVGPSAFVAAGQNEVWTSTINHRLVAGTFSPNGSPVIENEEYDSGFNLLTSGNTAISITTTQTRSSLTRTLTNASTAYTSFNVVFGFNAGDVIDFTLEFSRASLSRSHGAIEFQHTPSDANLTNRIDNSQLVGSVSGSPGTLPFGWSQITSAIGTMTRTVVGQGAENGIQYVDIQISGTPSGQGYWQWYIDELPDLRLISFIGQLWDASIYLKVAAGDKTNIDHIDFGWQELTSAGVYISENNDPIIIDGVLNRYVREATNLQSNTSYIVPILRVEWVVAAPINITLRVGRPQLELNPLTAAISTPPIRTLFAPTGFYNLSGSPSAGRAKTIVVSTGYYSLTGKTVALTKQKVISPNAGFYTLTGESVGIARGKKLSAIFGSYSVTGITASLLKTKTLAATFGSYIINGKAVGLARQKLITTATGFYSLTGEVVGLSRGKKLSAASGFYNLTGEIVAITRQKTLSVNAGYYSLTGESVSLINQRSITVAAGYYALTGESINLTKQAAKSISSDAGFYSVTGESVALLRAKALSFNTGYYTLAGENIAMSKSKTLVVNTGAYTVTGESAALNKNKTLTASTGYYTLVGEATSPQLTLPVATGYYVLTGEAASFALTMSAATGYYVLTGESVGFAPSMPVATGFYAITGEPVTFSISETVNAGFYAVMGEATTLSKTKSLSLTTGFYSITGQSVALLKGKTLTVDTGYYAVSGKDSTLTKMSIKTLLASTGFYVVTGETVSALKTKVLSLSTGFYSLAGESISLVKSQTLSANTGYYTSTGEAISLTHLRSVSAESGYYALTGKDASLTKFAALTLAADTGYYALTGKNAALAVQRTLNALAGFYNLVGNKTASQIASPISDISTGSWTTYLGGNTNLYQMVNEADPDDANYDQSSVLSVGQTDPIDFQFDTLSDPGSQPFFYDLSYRYRARGTASMQMTASLYCGVTLVGQWTHNAVGPTFQTATQQLDRSQIALITDYTQLHVKFTAAA